MKNMNNQIDEWKKENEKIKEQIDNFGGYN